jgi:hypothetical protein
VGFFLENNMLNKETEGKRIASLLDAAEDALRTCQPREAEVAGAYIQLAQQRRLFVDWMNADKPKGKRKDGKLLPTEGL